MHEGPTLTAPVVETTSGAVSGLALGGVKVFRGIPYAAPPLGALRFAPPQPVRPWGGIRPAHDFGAIAVQPALSGAGDPPPESRWYDAGAPRSEDCLRLHVWAPSAAGPARPVMVWIHGGAFAGGAGYGPWTDGSRLAAHEDVVVVSLNHRLGGFGFLSLAAFGSEYADSGNAGMLDIVAALRWVRDNIERFGGDPANVTVFGESGGGWKISALLAMPSARGLFGRAVIQSGSYLRAIPQEQADGVAHAVLARLDIAPSEIHRIHDVPVGTLERAMSRPFPPDAPATLFSDGTWTWNFDFGPVIDGRSLSRHPYHPDAPPESAGVGLLIGTTSDELSPETAAGPFRPGMTLVEMVAGLGVSHETAQAVLAAYRAERPGASDDEIFGGLQNDTLFSAPAVLQAERALAAGTEAVYSYLFAWPWPAQGNRAAHTAEIPFVFENLDADVVGAPLDDETRTLSSHVRAAWAAFARNGNPNVPGLPAWETYSVERRTTMVFDRECRVESDPRMHALRKMDGIRWT